MKNNYFIHGDVVWIELNRPKEKRSLFTVVDLDALEKVKILENKICANRDENTKGFYAVYKCRKPDGSWTMEKLHRFLMDFPENLVDHKNHDSLDNLYNNLRLATYRENNANSRSAAGSSSKYLGVSRYKTKWLASIKRIHLGYFDSEIDAAMAYDAAAIKYHGEFANLNFPEMW